MGHAANPDQRELGRSVTPVQILVAVANTQPGWLSAEVQKASAATWIVHGSHPPKASSEESGKGRLCASAHAPTVPKGKQQDLALQARDRAMEPHIADRLAWRFGDFFSPR